MMTKALTTLSITINKICNDVRTKPLQTSLMTYEDKHTTRCKPHSLGMTSPGLDDLYN